MDSKREDHPFVSKLMTLVALIVLFVLIDYVLQILRLRRDELVLETDEINLPVESLSIISDDIPASSLAEQTAAEESETSVEVLAQEAPSSMIESPVQDLSETLETHIDVSDLASSVSKEEDTSEVAVDQLTGEAYCMKCKQKRDMQNVQKIVTKNGRNALEGVCPVCGTRLFRFVSQS